MPDPQPHPELADVKRVAVHALFFGALIMASKFAVFFITNSATVLSDALESIINLVAAGMMMYTVWLANRPADRDHPYGHGKVEFMAVALEGWMILSAGGFILYNAVKRLIDPPELPRLYMGTWMLGGVAVMAAALAVYVWYSGRKYQSAALIADGKHLMTDAASTVGGIVGLVLVQWTGWNRLDPLVAIATAIVIFITSYKLLAPSIHGLMDRIDPADEAAIRAILEDELKSGAIKGYHKVRHRHTGKFHWVDLHLQVDPGLSVRQSHELASRIEGRIEKCLGHADATAHVEPYEPTPPAEATVK